MSWIVRSNPSPHAARINPPSLGVAAPARITTPVDWLRLVLGLVLVFGLFERAGAALGSDRGQAGLTIGALIVLALLAVERVLFGQPIRFALSSLGLGRPRGTGLLLAVGISGALSCVVPLFAASMDASVHPVPEWYLLLPGLFAQAGIAEETLFRGYLFNHLRVGRSFARAAVVATVPFVSVHLLMFLTLPWPIALAAVGLAVALSFPLARLFELGGGTIWPPALLHFVVQGTVKVITVSGGAVPFPLAWMLASAIVPLLVFAVPAGSGGQSPTASATGAQDARSRVDPDLMQR